MTTFQFHNQWEIHVDVIFLTNEPNAIDSKKSTYQKQLSESFASISQNSDFSKHRTYTPRFSVSVQTQKAISDLNGLDNEGTHDLPPIYPLLSTQSYRWKTEQTKDNKIKERSLHFLPIFWQPSIQWRNHGKISSRLGPTQIHRKFPRNFHSN